MRVFTRIPALLLAVTITLWQAAPVYAITISERKQMIAATNGISSAMKLVLEKYVGSEVTVQQLYDGAMQGMMDTLDEYSNFYDNNELSKHIDSVTGNFYGLGVTINMETGRPVIVRIMSDSPAKAAGLAVNDVILEIGGADVSSASLEEVMLLLGDKSQTTVELLISRDGERIPFSIEKTELQLDTVFLEKLSSVLPSAAAEDDGKIAYIYIQEVNLKTADDFREALRELQDLRVKRLILDLRGNPGGLMDVTIDLCCSLVPAGPIVTVMNKAGDLQVLSSELKKPPFEDIVILVDQYTASAAEIIVSAMQDADAATVVGQTTYGKGVGQSLFSVEGGSAIDITVLEFFSRNGKKINEVGVKPDVVVETPEYIQAAGVSLDENGCSPAVDEVKAALRYLGYATGEPGEYYDEKTRASVAAFQKEYALAGDGSLGYDTIVSLNIAMRDSKNDPALQKAYEIIQLNQ